MADDWKQHHADEAEKALAFHSVEFAIDELLDNLGRRDDPLARYGICKVASYAAQVARAQALGFDPEFLRSTPEESYAAQLRLAEIAALRGIPVWAIEDGPEGE